MNANECKPGMRVTTSGFPGVIVRHYDGNMFEVRLDRGLVCVDCSDIRAIAEDGKQP